jgi:hypothetical protein
VGSSHEGLFVVRVQLDGGCNRVQGDAA